MKQSPHVERPKAKIEKEAVIWSIGLYAADVPFEYGPPEGVENPIISAEDVTDVRAESVAEPFMINVDGIWQMFFAVMNAETETGEIGWATSQDARVWQYQRIVLREPFALSYPCVFCVDEEYYMLPQTTEAKSINLYKADRFPEEWSLVGNILDGEWVSPSVFFFDGRWWMFATPAASRNCELDLFFAESLAGPWSEHPMNPIVEGDRRKARPAGRVTVSGDKPIRFAQDCRPYYGSRVRAFEIYDLTTSRYGEREVEESPVLSARTMTWNRSGMHHIDLHSVEEGWLACVDGWRRRTELNYFKDAWQLQIHYCPWDLQFVQYLELKGFREKLIFHFGTGEHHLVGRNNHERGSPNEIIGITASMEEYDEYIDFVINNPVAANRYKVLWGDVYTLSPQLLPNFDIVSLFHLCEYYTEQNATYARLNDLALLEMFLSKLNPGGKIVFSRKPGEIMDVNDPDLAFMKVVASMIGDFVAQGKLVVEDEYETLLVCGRPADGSLSGVQNRKAPTS